jgi:hypothetical protein
MAGTDWYPNPFDSDALDLGDDFQLDAGFSVDFDFGLHLDNTAANAPVIGAWANEPFPSQEQAYDHAAPFASVDADIPADRTLGDMSDTDESTDGDSKHDSPMSVRTGRNTVSAGSSAGNYLAESSNSNSNSNTLPTPTASNKRRRGTQDEVEDQRPAQRRATTSVASPTEDAPPVPLPLGPVPTIVRGTCVTPAPPTHSNGNGEKRNRAGKMAGWAQARQDHKNNCTPFAVGGCDAKCLLRAQFPVTCRKWDEQRFLIEWRDAGKQQQIVSGFFIIDAEKSGKAGFRVCGELDASGAIYKKSKTLSCWDVAR